MQKSSANESQNCFLNCLFLEALTKPLDKLEKLGGLPGLVRDSATWMIAGPVVQHPFHLMQIVWLEALQPLRKSYDRSAAAPRPTIQTKRFFVSDFRSASRLRWSVNLRPLEAKDFVSMGEDRVVYGGAAGDKENTVDLTGAVVIERLSG